MELYEQISEKLQKGKAKDVKALVQQAIDEGLPVQEILEKEENYLDWTTTQIDLIESVGIENYIQSQL